MNDRQRLEAIVAVVCRYLPPDGISREEAMSQIISLVDPLPEQQPVSWAETNDMVCALLRQAHDVLACASYPIKRPWVGLTDDEIKDILDCGRGGLVDIKKAEQILRGKNNG